MSAILKKIFQQLDTTSPLRCTKILKFLSIYFRIFPWPYPLGLHIICTFISVVVYCLASQLYVVCTSNTIESLTLASRNNTLPTICAISVIATLR
jgi:hypothetical protein